MAREALDSGAAARTFEAIVSAQGRLDFPDPAAFRAIVESNRDGRIQSVDCVAVNRIAKLAGSPAHPAAGLVCLHKVGDVIHKNEAVFEIHAQSRTQLEMACEFASVQLSSIVHIGY
jgi:thymidine phosphorylase